MNAPDIDALITILAAALPFVLILWFGQSRIARSSFDRQVAALEARCSWSERDGTKLATDLGIARAEIDTLNETLDTERAAVGRTSAAQLWASVAERMPDRLSPWGGWPKEGLAALVDEVDGNLEDVAFYVFAGPSLVAADNVVRPSLLAARLVGSPPPVAFWGAAGRSSALQSDPPSDAAVETRAAVWVAGMVRGLIADLAKAKAARVVADRNAPNPAGGIADDEPEGES